MKDKKVSFLKVALIATMLLFAGALIFMVIAANNVAVADSATVAAPTNCSINTTGTGSNSVNLRLRPNKDGALLTTARNGVYVKRLAEYYGDYQWSLVATLDYTGNPERLGFMMSRYLNGYASSNTVGSYQTTQATAPKDLYAYLTTDSAAKGMIPKGNSVIILGLIGDHSLVQFGGNLYLVKSVDLWGYDPNQHDDGSYPYEAKVVAKTGKTVNFRSAPDKNNKNNILDQIPIGNTVTVTGQYDITWSIVSWNGRTGYMMTEFLVKKDAKPTTEPYFDPYITVWDHTLHTYYGDYVLPAGVSYALENADWVRVDD